LSEEGVNAALDASHALVLPSFAEGLPMVIMEAMAAARAVITTYVAGIPELVQDGQTGWLVPAGDVDALCHAVDQAAQTPADTLRKMGERGRERVLQRHAIDGQVEKLRGYFAKVEQS
jgi:glycosyltransferase involved in cell wall biosynthesis